MNSLPTPKNRRWMLVDDDKNVLIFIQEIISRFGGIETECFESPYAALAAFTIDPDKFELVITDLEMPGMDGVELCHHLLKLKPDTKILLSTGSAAVTETFAARAGFCGLLHKPIPFTEVRRLIGVMGITEISHPE